jgi:hypothetical protein
MLNDSESLREEYSRLRAIRRLRTVWAFALGTIGGGAVTLNLAYAVLTGLFSAAGTDILLSFKINELENIIYPGGKK